MSEAIGSIGPVGRISGVEPVAMPLSGAMAGQRGAARRERRLRWLASVREALGDSAPLDDEITVDDGDDTLPAMPETRARIADALGVADAMRCLAGEAEPDGAPNRDGHGGTITAASLARRISASADQSLRGQARLGAAAVRRLMGEEK